MEGGTEGSVSAQSRGCEILTKTGCPIWVGLCGLREGKRRVYVSDHSYDYIKEQRYFVLRTLSLQSWRGRDRGGGRASKCKIFMSPLATSSPQAPTMVRTHLASILGCENIHQKASASLQLLKSAQAERARKLFSRTPLRFPSELFPRRERKNESRESCLHETSTLK